MARQLIISQIYQIGIPVPYLAGVTGGTATGPSVKTNNTTSKK